MSATLSQVVQDALVIIGEVAGAGVQMYGEDRLRADTIRAFDMLFKKNWWDQYLSWDTVILDGATGGITTDAFANVRDYEDFYSINRAGTSNPLPVLSKRLNPSTLTGSRAMFWGSLPATHANFLARRIKVYPAASVGSIDVLSRVYPIPNGQEWADSTRIDLDRNMLAYGGAFLTLATDDVNPAGATVAKTMMEMYYKTARNALAGRPMPIEGVTSDIPQNWFESR